MLGFVAALGLIVLALFGVVLYKTYFYMPLKELKRQAENGNDLARGLYRAAAYGDSLRLYLWLWIGLASAGGFVLLARMAPPWLGFAAIALLLWIAFLWLPSTRLTGVGARLALLVTPAITWKLNYLHPILGRAAGLARRWHPREAHTHLYERDDLLELIERQRHQADSRFAPEELDFTEHVLRFRDYKVRDVLRPRKHVKSVSVTDQIGPILLDELHASGQTAFPVHEANDPAKIVATLHLGDVGIKSKGAVADHSKTGVYYVHESDSLAEALHIFHQTRHQLLVAVNSFEEYVGIVTLEDILQRLVGRSAAHEHVSDHANPTAVAARHPQKQAAKPPKEPKTAQGAQNRRDAN